MINISYNNWPSLVFNQSDKRGMHVLQQLCLLADLEGSQIKVPCDFDVADDIHVLTVGKLDFLSIRKLHFKHVSSQLQHQLK